MSLILTAPQEPTPPVLNQTTPLSTYKPRTRFPKPTDVITPALEEEIAKLLGEGLSHKDIAGKLNINRQTITSHVRRKRKRARYAASRSIVTPINNEPTP